jgi:predicted SAM-dependent methyltransferase
MEDALVPVSSKRVLNPQAVVGFVNGSIWVHCGDTNQMYSSSDPNLLRLLAAFLTPADPEQAVKSLGRSEAPRHVEELARIGALLPAEAQPCVDHAGRSGNPAALTPGDLVQSHLAPMALALDSLSTTLAAIGPEIDESITRDTGLGLRTRLVACSAAFIAIRRELDKRIPDWIRAQLGRLNLSERGLNVHLGAGSARLDGWLSVDVWPAELSLDLRWGLPFADAGVERMYLSHTLEHLWYPGEVNRLFKEARRVLSSRGRIRIIVPDIELAIHAYVENDTRFFAGRRESAWPEWDITTRMESFLGYAGVGPHPGRFADAHKYGYDFETVAHALTEAGFRDIRRCTYQGSADPMMRIDHVSAYADAQVDGRYYSLFVEAGC